jgi:Zn-dependent peptidase ImmA (M78 family)
MGMVVEEIKKRVKLPAENLPQFPAVTLREIEAAAENTRKHWTLNGDAPLMHVGRVMENAGVMIVPHLVKSPKIDAFSRQGKTTLIFLNQCIQSTSRWIFDIAHECGHLVIHGGIGTGDTETERAADRFASALLLPNRAFSREFKAAPFSWRHIFELKRHWRASAAAIVTRAYHLDLISAVDYRRAFQYMSAKGWRSTGEPYEPAFQEPELLSMALRAVGTRPGSLAQFCDELGFSRKAFEEITGMRVPKAPAPKPTPILVKGGL